MGYGTQQQNKNKNCFPLIKSLFKFSFGGGDIAMIFGHSV